LALGVIVAIACFLAFKSGAQGTTKLGAPAGCLIACALMVFAFLGAAACVVAACVAARSELVRRGPVKSLEFHWDKQKPSNAAEAASPGESASEGGSHAATSNASRYRARLVVELRGSPTDGQIAQITGTVSRWLRDATDHDFSVSTSTSGSGKDAVTRLDFG